MSKIYMNQSTNDKSAKREDKGINYLNNSKAFVDYSETINNVNEDYNLAFIVVTWSVSRRLT